MPWDKSKSFADWRESGYDSGTFIPIDRQSDEASNIFPLGWVVIFEASVYLVWLIQILAFDQNFFEPIATK